MKKIITILFIIGFFNGNALGQLTADTSTSIRLTAFNAGVQNNEVKLYWKVACRVSYALFEVQRSSDGTNFSTINSFQADYLRCLQPFNFTDPTATGLVFYRLKVGDIDGRFSTEKVLKLTGREIRDTKIKIVSPVTGSFLSLIVEAGSNEIIWLNILNMAGNSIQNLSINPGKGINQMEIPLLNFKAGMYILNYQTAGKKRSARFVKSN
jgi:hypothetical protein